MIRSSHAGESPPPMPRRSRSDPRPVPTVMTFAGNKSRMPLLLHIDCGHCRRSRPRVEAISAKNWEATTVVMSLDEIVGIGLEATGQFVRPALREP